MQKYLTTLGRILLAQIFLVQVIALIVSFMNNPNGYQEYQAGLGSLGLPLQNQGQRDFHGHLRDCADFPAQVTVIAISSHRRGLVPTVCKSMHGMQFG